MPQSNTIAQLLASLVVILGVLSLATGLLRLFFSGAQHQQEEWLESLHKGAGTIERELGLTRFSSVVSIGAGVFLIALGRSLHKGSRRAWWVTVVIMGLLSLSFLLVRTKLQLPGGNLLPRARLLLGFLALFILAGLIISRRYFTAKLHWNLTTAQVAALVAILVALAYGVLGTYALRDGFNKPNMKWLDALYFTIITYTTLGYGDITPVSESAKWFTISVVLVGISSFITAATVILGPVIQDRLMGVFHLMRRKDSGDFKNHVIICGYTTAGQSVVRCLSEKNKSFVIVESDRYLAESLSNQDMPVIEGDPTLEDTLLSANITAAESIIACLDDDAQNAMITLIANDLRKQGKCENDLRIIARAEYQSAIARMKSAGADYVISPSTTAGKAMAELSVETDAQNRSRISEFWE
jgi:voltage-gated potassium channel